MSGGSNCSGWVDRGTVRPRLGVPGLLVLGLGLGARPLAGQAVRGQLVDRANGFPIGGAFVVLLDQGGTEVARALTSDAGTFLIRAPVPGTYRLQSKRIGFRMQESPPIVLDRGQTLTYRLEIEAIPARLPPVVVEGRPQCGNRGEEGSAVAQLWEEAREALAAVRWVETERPYRYSLHLYERDYGVDGERVEQERSWTRSGSYDTPFKSVPAESLAAHGYVVGDDREGRTYYAPDAAVLLSEVFLEGHCFTAREGTGELAGLVGLAFAPAPGRRLPDVRGVLWVDRESAELRFLEYRYANLPAALPEGALGGRVEFLRLQTGAWIVLNWSIRMPLLGLVVDRLGRRQDLKLLGFRERGGRVTAIQEYHTGRLAYSAAMALVDGTVVDSTRHGRPLAGARVLLAGTAYGALSDSGGHFQIAAPIEGTYGIGFTHPRLDSLALGLEPRPVRLERGRRTSLLLAVPPESAIVGRLCPGGLGEGERVVVGVVRDPGGRPVPGAEVRGSWRAGGAVAALRATPMMEARSVADSAGRYVLCAVPQGRVRLEASGGEGLQGAVVLQFEEQGVWVDEQHYRTLTGRVWSQDVLLRR